MYNRANIPCTFVPRPQDELLRPIPMVLIPPLFGYAIHPVPGVMDVTYKFPTAGLDITAASGGVVADLHLLFVRMIGSASFTEPGLRMMGGAIAT